MLDQNTDRMWYVIGAVLIGAAIIFGMNTLMPEAFASVGDNVNTLIEVVDRKMYDLSPKVGAKHWVEDYLNDTSNWYQGGILSDGTDSGNEHALLTGYVEIEPGEYSIEYTVDDLDEFQNPVFTYAVYDRTELDDEGNKLLTQRGDNIRQGQRFIVDEPSLFRVRIAYMDSSQPGTRYIKDELFQEEMDKWTFKVHNYVLKERISD